MIPQAGSAYAYSYATLGELIAWIIGWDLILEYAVGNIAVAIAWSGYFTSLLSGFGIDLPGVADARLPHGAPQLRSGGPRPAADGAAASPAFRSCSTFRRALIVLAITWLLYIGVRESTRANNVMVVVKLLVLGLFVVLGAMHIDPANYKPFAPNGWRGHSPGRGDRVLRLHRLRRDLDRRGRDEEPAAQHADRHPRRAGDLHASSTSSSASWRPAWCRISSCKAADPLARALEVAGLPTASWIVAFGAVVSLTAVLLVFQYGQPRIFLAMARDGLLPAVGREDPPEVPDAAHHHGRRPGSSSPLGSLVVDENEIYDLTNIGTLCAFAIVCVGVLVLRYKDPDRPRPFRVPFVWPVALLGAAACVYIMNGLPTPRLGAVRHLAGAGARAVLRLRLPPQRSGAR